MTKVYQLLFLITLFLGGNWLFTSCSNDDDKIDWNGAEVTNAELKSVLQQKGFTFNEQGRLVRDSKVLDATTLDLSGCNLSDVSGLDVFPKLEEINLANNNLDNMFDFSILPATVNSIDLTANVIYDYNGLVNVVIEENGDQTVTQLRTIKKLYLPETAKYDYEAILPFYRKNKDAIDGGTINVQMADSNGTLKKYTTLREVPDDTFREYLRENFSSLFFEDYLDMNKSIGTGSTQFVTTYVKNEMLPIKDLEGVQYIIQHPQWIGTMISLAVPEEVTLPKIKVGSSVIVLLLKNINISEDLDLSEAGNLSNCVFEGLNGINSIDLTHSSRWGQQDAKQASDATTGTSLVLVNSPLIKTVKLPAIRGLRAQRIALHNLPELQEFDLTKFGMINYLEMGDLPDSYELKYPDLTEFYLSDGMTVLAISTRTYNRQVSKDYIIKYRWESTPKRLDSMGSTVGFTSYRKWNYYRPK